MSQTRDQQRFTISEVAADWHEPIVPQRIMCPSIACANEQLDCTNGAASRHTIAPISHTRPSPHSHSYYSFPIPLRVGGWVGLEEGLLNEFVVAEDISWYCEMQNSFLVNLMQKLSKLVKICKVIAKKFTANFYWTAIILFLPVLFVFEKFRHGPPIRWREYRSGRPI